jgi:hypothetical protein
MYYRRISEGAVHLFRRPSVKVWIRLIHQAAHSLASGAKLVEVCESLIEVGTILLYIEIPDLCCDVCTKRNLGSQGLAAMQRKIIDN